MCFYTYAENWNHSFGKWQGQNVITAVAMELQDHGTCACGNRSQYKGNELQFICGNKSQGTAEAASAQVLNGVRRSWSALINWDPALCGGRKPMLPHLIAGRKGELIRFIKHWLIQVMNTIKWHYYSARFFVWAASKPKISSVPH